jgi:hypothetical protein
MKDGSRHQRQRQRRRRRRGRANLDKLSAGCPRTGARAPAATTARWRCALIRRVPLTDDIELAASTLVGVAHDV